MALGASIGALSGLVGAGGGFRVVPALEIVGDLGLSEAIATSPSSPPSSRSRASPRHRRRRLELVGLLAAAAVIGCLAGARAAPRVSPAALRRGFSSAAWVLKGDAR